MYSLVLPLKLPSTWFYNWDITILPLVAQRLGLGQLERPPHRPHFGSMVERLFEMTTTELLNQLRGNTQASKTPRQMTREVGVITFFRTVFGSYNSLSVTLTRGDPSGGYTGARSGRTDVSACGL